MAQQLNGRRGAVFSVRVTDAERAELEAAQAADSGPRSLGPWLVWRALTTWRASLQTSRKTRVGSTRLEQVVPDQPASQPPDRLILDLCAGSGAWSAPYVERGYRVERVTLPELDVRTYAPPPNVWGILAAPPCDQFSAARNGCDSPRDFVRGLETVSACMRIIATARPRWWALENPTGMLSRWLGTPRDTFEPCDFGDPWTKRTALWGDFTIPTRGPFVAPLGSGPVCVACDPSKRATTHCYNAAHRAQTPAGFAHAFCEANP